MIERMCMHIRTGLAQLTIRLPDNLRQQMERFRDLNWSEVIREAIRSRILLETKRKASRNRRMMLRAVRRQDEIAEALASKYSGTWSGVEVIRYWRDHRYSSLTRR